MLSEHDSVSRFETLMDELREQVALLEQEHLSLSDAIAAYEKSVELANECHRLLDDAELRIEKIDLSTRALQEAAVGYRAMPLDAARLLLGDDDDDLMDLLDDE